MIDSPIRISGVKFCFLPASGAPFGPTVSPDGKLTALYRHKSEQSHAIALMPINGGEIVNLNQRKISFFFAFLAFFAFN